MSENIYKSSSMTIENTRVKQVIDTKNMGIAIAGFISAFAMIAASSFLKIESSEIKMTLIAVGGIVLVFSLYLLLNKNKKLIYNPSKSDLRHKTCYVLSSQRYIAEKWLEEGFTTPAPDLKIVGDGNVRFDALVSDDKRFVAIQLFEYENFRFEPMSDVIYLYDDDTKSVLHLF